MHTSRTWCRAESAREGGADAATVEVDDLFALTQREDDALIESVDYRSSPRIEIGEALAERQPARQLDEANQVSALSAAVAVENILASVDIERGLGLLVQRTEPDELGSARRMTSPVMLPQILNQRHPPLECFDVLSHGVFFASGAGRRQSQARMVGDKVFSHRRSGQSASRAGVIHDNGSVSLTA